jgi:hypothetical protein
MTYDAKVRSFVPIVALREAWAAGRRRLKRHLFYARFAAYPSLAQDKPPPAARPRVLAAVVHIVSEQEYASREAAAVKIDRLVTTLDGLLCSFAHCELKVLLVTMSRRHVTRFLPQRLQDAVEVVLADGGDPMFVGFPAQDALIERRDQHDWFMFLEDDIEIRDSAFLDKVSRFCALPGMERAVLMPNRFEYVDGVKRYIDLTHVVDHINWNKLSLQRHDGNLFAECSNPHAGMFLLSRAQLGMLIDSGRDWRGLDIFGGSRESAATFSLMECFVLYKPHVDNLYYLEVRHVDSKYSLMHPQVTEYTYSATATAPAPVRAAA